MGQKMSTGWSFFDNFDGLVYVADIDTHELAYVNKKTMEIYGLQKSDLIGRPCYSLLQNNAAPCTFCNNCELQEGQFLKWDYYNPILDRYMLLHDTMVKKDGHRYRMEIAFDVSRQEEYTRANDWQQTMERLVNEAIAVAIQKPTPDETMACLLESIGRILKGDRVYIFEKNENGNMDNTYEWVAAGITPEKENLQDVPGKTFEVWKKSFQKDNMVVIKDAEQTRHSDPQVYAYLEPQKVHSLVVVPFFLHIDNGTYGTELEIDGFYGIDNPPAEYLEHTKTILRIVSHFILGILKRRNLIRELQHLSLIDHQTKLGNRHAMNQYMAELKDWKQMGVVYCDITGLKMVNDTQGHQEGDRLIQRACESLQKEFCGYAMFRIGGDELLVVCPEIEEVQLLQQADSLRQHALEHEVVLAVGTSWTSDGTENMENMMFCAEQNMYRDKQKYYQESGRDRRRR